MNSFWPDQDEALAGLPLAARRRPRTLDEFVGQDHLIGPGRVLRRAIEHDRFGSFILWGPPGSGKTTLAEIVARLTRSRFIPVSAVSAGVADLRRAVEEARKLRQATGQRSVLFIDEIHRFNKAQQDAILPHVERGTVTLIGATTENPSFEVNAALLSRCRVFPLRALGDAEIETLLRRALADPERGLARENVVVDEDAVQHLVRVANGDARVALNGLELAAGVAEADPAAGNQPHVTLALVEEAVQWRALGYDKTGDQHYDLISAFIKSIRGSDPDAGLYYLARMLDAGEDPLFIVRRLVILAAEDIGLADPQALSIAVAAQQAVHFVGLPEGYLPMAEAVIYLATAPKSNSVIASYGRALEDVQRSRADPPPLHLRNAPTRLMKDLGHGRGYLYAHDHYAPPPEQGGDLPPAERLQQYLPDAVADQRYYQPGAFGYEARLREWVRRRNANKPEQ